MDSASIAPLFQCQGNGNFFSHSKRLRDELRERLVSAYRLREFSLFLVPSVTHGMMALVQLSAFNGRRVALAQGSHYAPIARLFSSLAHTPIAVAASLITTHVCPYTGVVRQLSCHASQLELVDATHSFATNLHDDLLDTAKIFLAPLHKHAELAVGLALIAVRTKLAAEAPYDMLSLLESSTASQAPLVQALRNFEHSGAYRFNKAAVGVIHSLPADLSLCRVSSVDFSLPFACFRHAMFGRLDKSTLHHAGATYFPISNTLRIAKWLRGTMADTPTDFAEDVQATIAKLMKTL